MPYRLLHILMLFLLFIIAACSSKHTDERLKEISLYVGDSPEAAIEHLDSIDYRALAPADRHFYNLLSIKARDKAYVTHTSDSTILDVIDWYASHPDEGLYPEALYYGGRVYCDLGDSPTALKYFQQALDLLPEESGNPVLRACVLSQTGRLLYKLRLYNEAIPFLKETIRMDSFLKDSINMVHNLLLLGLTEIRIDNYKDAGTHFSKAYAKSHGLSDKLMAKSKMYLGLLNYYTGNIDSALMLIRDTPDSVSYLSQNSAFAFAARIYREAGIPDTAMMYAQRLIGLKDNTNKRIAYQILLSPELKGVVPRDSVLSYVSAYSDLLNKQLDENENQLALYQQTLYNYNLHKRERLKAEAEKAVMGRWIAICVAVMLILALCILLLRIKNKNYLIRLQQAAESIDLLKLKINASPSTPETGNEAAPDILISKIPDIEKRPEKIKDVSVPPIKSADNATALRDRLRKQLLMLSEKSEKTPLSTNILNSAPYHVIQKKIEEKRVLTENDEIWHKLEETVLKESPDFITNLRILTLGNLTSIDLRTALLIKCHIKPSQMTALFGKSNGAIISRRESLCVKIFGEKLGVKIIDNIIRLL